MEGTRGCNAGTRADPGDDVRRVFDGGAAAVGATGVDAPCETTRRVAIVAIVVEVVVVVVVVVVVLAVVVAAVQRRRYR